MLTIDALRNPSRESGFNYVGRAGGAKKKPWRAQKNAGNKYGSNATFRGPTRERPAEAAQDYCDYINSGVAPSAPSKPALKSAGHDTTPRKPLPRDPEVQAALGVLRDARAQRRGEQGYVYLIIEDLPGGAVIYGKIGYSTNPRKRVAELQTGNPRPLRLLRMKPGTEADEAALHQKYIKHNVLQEWFHITKELLLEWDASHQVSAAA